MIKPQTLKGFRDFLPQQAKKRLWLRNRLENIFQLWGFDPIETPTLEPLDIFQGQIGEDEKLFFKFKDPGGRDVALRYDQTLPSVRMVSQYLNTIPLPFKRYQIQPAFRAEKPQKGRYREFVQCDADIFGDPSAYADAETIALSLDIYKQLGFKVVKVLINDRNLLTDIPYPALVAIDKQKKIGNQQVIKEMMNKGIDKAKAEYYLDKISRLKPSVAIKIILQYLNDYGFAQEWYEFDPTIVRSFSYSQGPIWEVVIPGFTAGSVLGGERYDGLFKTIFGIEMYGTGFGLGFDRTLEALDEFGLIPSVNASTKVLITVFNAQYQTLSLSTGKSLRKNNINCEVYPNPKVKLDKQLKYADKKGIPYVVIIGPDEAQKNVLTVRNMKDKQQKTVPLEELISDLLS
ncbi:histidine--tRNA ligase [Candidatus Gottesmanbacteria bacterium RIFCSPHIGHO2_02_FULL_39_14]|uniref:Histidine--tRNA ligase n=2 Tax=Candidatus Gottesmaniibacteriota TaxID=1752720 RepID=A0A1F5ZTI6_9BACT|nr:MAG: histidine--tRNA ligase [Candidatus Gottesmanbacteria bacterium RIFCSPHIGHO2_02_FULL_39_14]OGG30962.1 MAG: histidine--tRNA ligase [Candidatus Gottesmanbacteria bacterium RIFCSPLOWO2_02_FULL_38_8]